MEIPENGFTPEGLASELVEKIDAAEYFKIAYNSAIVDALINGQTPIIGKYLGEELSLSINLHDYSATVNLPEGEVVTYPLDKSSFDALLEQYRNQLNGEQTGLDPNALAQSLYIKLALKERYFSILAASVETAAILGHADVLGRDQEHQFTLVINYDYATAALYKGDDLVVGYDINTDAFIAVKEAFEAEE